MNGNFKRNLMASTGVSLLILLVSSTASFVSIRSLLTSNDWVKHTQTVINELTMGSFVMADAQTSIRGYLITGRLDYLEQYLNADERADAHFDKVDLFTRDNPAQQQDIKKLTPLRESFFRYLEERVQEKKLGKSVDPQKLGTGKMLMDKMRTIIRHMQDRENELLRQRNLASVKYGSYSSILIVVAALLSILISLVFFVRILNDYRERLKLQLELQQKDREMAERIRVISGLAGQISQGNYNIRINDSESDALGSVAVSLNNMAGSLHSSFSLLTEKEWHQAGIAQLNNVMIGEKNLKQLSEDVIEFLATYTNSAAGVMYVMESDELEMMAGYSYKPNKSRERIAAGEGLVGQAVVSGKMLELKIDSADSIKISYALGEVKPHHIVAFPLPDSTMVGAIELASASEFAPRILEFLNASANNIGIAIKAAQNRKRVQELLEETQSQSEELRVQHSELENMNAELETQTEKLQASEEELKVQQEELQQTNEELAERSVLLEEQNVEIQKKSEALELSTRYKSEFLANMSHELRTPLNSILLLSRLLAENNDANMNLEQIEFARVIQSSGNGLLGLIDEILDLSKIEAGKMELEITEIAVAEIANNMKSLFTEVAKEKGIAFDVISKAAPMVMKTDNMRLEQILKNLLSNAIKFTSKGSVTLEIRTHEKDAKFVNFIVKDTGIGIPHEQQRLIFEAFQQADGSTKRKYGGTGLGLSISRELAKLLKGQITVQSETGKGSEFILTVPVSVSSIGQLVSEASYQQETAKSSGKTLEEQFLNPIIPQDIPDDRENITASDKTILIVEDDTNFAKTLLDFTRKRGYKGVVSVRGDYALDFALKYKPVGILLDIELPIKNGWEVMDELKGNLQTKHIPVHIMSSHSVKKESLLKGAVNFLDKPVAFDQIPEVFRRIEHIINRESQKVLIIEDNSKHAKALAFFLETNSINSEIKSDVSEGVSALQQSNVDCVILDMGIPDNQAYEILENIKKNEGLENLPVIVFTGKSLSMNEELKIKKYADSIVIKTAHSYQRMLDEVSLFLHIVEEQKSDAGNKPDLKKLQQLNNVLNGKTVLVVDDDVRNIYSLTKALEVLKMNVITAIDGKEALTALKDHPQTDVVLLDMMMPNMDGYETAKRIREDKKFKKLPVIAVTAKAMTGDREKCINAGASDYITKPVDVDQLLSLLRVWLYDKN